MAHRGLILLVFSLSMILSPLAAYWATQNNGDGNALPAINWGFV